MLPSGAALRIEFQRDADRCRHDILLDLPTPSGQRRIVPLLASREGSSNDSWPASPALQNLSVEELAPNKPVALLVGMAGRSHWSASVEVDPARAALVFDIACRVSQPPRWLGTTYAVCPDFRVTRGDGDLLFQLLRAAAGVEVLLAALPIASEPTAAWEILEAANPAEGSVEKGLVQIQCCVEAVPRRLTYRWKYRLQLRPAASASTRDNFS